MNIPDNFERRLFVAEENIKKIVSKYSELEEAMQMLKRGHIDMRCGALTIPAAGSEHRMRIDFSPPFSSPPVVVANAGFHQDDHLIVSLRDIHGSGCEAWIRRSNGIGWGSPQTLNWIACEKKP